MKACVVALLLFIAVRARCAERWLISTKLEIAQVPESVAIDAIPRLLDPSTSKATWDRLVKSPKEGVQILACVGVEVPDGEVASAFLGEEVSLPFRYRRADPRAYRDFPAAATQPTTGYPFEHVESASIGTTLQARTRVLPEGSLLTMCGMVGKSALAGSIPFETGLLANGTKLRVEKLRIAHRVYSGAVVLRPGVPQLLGAYKLPPPAQREFELHVLTSTAKSAVGFPKARETKPQFEPEPDPVLEAPKWQASAEMIRFRIKEESGLSFRRNIPVFGNAPGAIDKLLALVRDGEATLMDWHVFPSAGVGSNRSESVVDVRMPCDDDTYHSIPQTFGPGSAPWVDNSKVWEDQSPSRRTVEPPWTFETERLGSTCDIGPLPPRQWLGERDYHPVVSPDGRVIYLQYSAGLVEFARFRRWLIEPDESGTSGAIFRPEYFRRRTGGELALANGVPAVIGFHKLPSGDGVEITIARASAVKPAAAGQEHP